MKAIMTKKNKGEIVIRVFITNNDRESCCSRDELALFSIGKLKDAGIPVKYDGIIFGVDSGSLHIDGHSDKNVAKYTWFS